MDIRRVARESPGGISERGRLSGLELTARESMVFRGPVLPVKRQQNQFGCKEASGKPWSFSCKMSVDLPKIKFHILWAKDYFLFQG